MGKRALVSSKIWYSVIALLATGPYLVPQIWSLFDIDNFTDWLSYYWPFVMNTIWVTGTVLLFLEIILRMILSRKHVCPWFAAAGLLFIALFSFELPRQLAKPLVQLNPRWCRVYQDIRWEVNEDSANCNDSLGYILVLTGHGNIRNYKLTGGYLNWTGDEPAGMSSIDFESMTFGYCYEEEPLTHEKFSLRVQNTPLSDSTKQMLIEEIWGVLQQAKAGNPISAEHGTIEPLQVAPMDNEDQIAGGVIWVFLLVIIFQILGRLTLGRKPRTDLISAR